MHERADRGVLLERFDFDPSTKVRAYSKRNRQKLILVAALMSRADLLLVDEPTARLVTPTTTESEQEPRTRTAAGTPRPD